MKNLILNLIFIIIIVFSSCNSPIDKNEIIGLYKNSNDSAIAYNKLLLRDDSTYSFVQALWGSDHFLIHNGLWELNRNSVILCLGFDFTDYLLVDTVYNRESETLQIELDSSLLKQFPQIKLSIENYKDLNFKGNKLTISKADYALDRELYENFDYTLDEFPVKIVLRQKNFYASFYYAFANEKIKISVRKNIPKEEKRILLKYRVEDSVLKSYYERPNKIRRNKLKKMTDTEIKSLTTIFQTPSP